MSSQASCSNDQKLAMRPRATSTDDQDQAMPLQSTSDTSSRTEKTVKPAWKMTSRGPDAFGLGDPEGHKFRVGDDVPEEVNEFFRNLWGNPKVVKYEDLPEWILEYEIPNAKESDEEVIREAKRKIQEEKDRNRAWLVGEMRRRIAEKEEREKEEREKEEREKEEREKEEREKEEREKEEREKEEREKEEREKEEREKEEREQRFRPFELIFGWIFRRATAK